MRGTFSTVDEIKTQVAIALGDTSKLVLPEGKTIQDYGVGNPLIETPENGDLTDVPTIALNRYLVPDKKFWNNVVPTDVEDPHKASAAVRFSLRVHFRDDFAYIDFGCPWEKTQYGDNTLNPSSSHQDFLNNLVFLKCHFISFEDALQILDSIFGNVTENTLAYHKLCSTPRVDIMTTELVDGDGSIIAL